MEERLNWMDEHYLSKYDETVIDSAIPKQKAFDTVKELTMEYPVLRMSRKRKTLIFPTDCGRKQS